MNRFWIEFRLVLEENFVKNYYFHKRPLPTSPDSSKPPCGADSGKDETKKARAIRCLIPNQPIRIIAYVGHFGFVEDYA